MRTVMTMLVFVGRMVAMPLRLGDRDDFWFTGIFVSVVGAVIATYPKHNVGHYEFMWGLKPFVLCLVSLCICIAGTNRDSLRKALGREWRAAQQTASRFEKHEPSDADLLRPVDRVQ